MTSARPVGSLATPRPITSPSAPSGPDPDGSTIRRPGWPGGLRYSALVYVLTRVPAVGALLLFMARHPKVGLTKLATTWDGWWYLQIAEHGYTSSLRIPVSRSADWHHSFSTWAFFPGYPLVLAGVHALTQAPMVAVAIVVSLVFGLLAVWATYGLGAEYGGPRVGRGAALLLAAWPGSAILGQPYSEGLYLAAAAAALTMLLRRRWVAAGLLGLVATLTRPTGIAVVVAAGAVALVHLVRHRDPRPLAAPVLGVSGLVVFAAYGWDRTGDLFVWRHAENLWSQHFDLSHKLLIVWYRLARQLPSLIRTEGGREAIATNGLQVAGALALAVLVVTMLRRWRGLSMPLVWYTGVALLTVLAYSAVGPRPRTLMALVPGFVWAADRWPRRVTLVVAAVMTPLIGVVEYLWLWKITP